MKKNALKDCRSDKVFYAVNACLLLFFFLITLYPLMSLISGGISSPGAVYTGKVTFYPVGFSLKGIAYNLQNPKVLKGFANSVFYTVVGTCLNVTVTLFTGYALSRKELPLRSGISFLLSFTMWFSGGLIPTYLLVRDIGMLNTRWALLIPGLISVYNTIVCRTYIQSTIPEEMFEAATIDGCGYFRFLFAMVLPLSGAIVAVLTLWYAIDHWNEYFNALVYVYDINKQPLQMYLRQVLVTSNTVDMSDVESDIENLGIQELIKNSLILVSCLPLWIAYPFVQKYFVKGVMIGSVKG